MGRKSSTITVSADVDVSLDEFDDEDILEYAKTLGLPKASEEDNRNIENAWRALAEGDIAEAADCLRAAFPWLRPFDAEKRIAACYKPKDSAHANPS